MVERKVTPPQEIYTPYLLTPLIQKAVITDALQFRAGSSQRKEIRNNILQSVWGSTNEDIVKISPSIAANCLRWIGYEALGYTPSPQPFEDEIGRMIGSASHYALLRKLKDFGLSEQSLIDEEHGISGRHVDAKKEGFNVSMGNVVYINRNDGKIKEALVPWDAVADYDIKDFLEKVKVASDQIKKSELPIPTVTSEYICASFCPYRIYCEYGQKFAAGRVRRESKRKPNWVYVKAREEAAKAREKMEKLGLVQPQLFTIDSTGKIQT